jgi:hypothetical protein
MVHMSEEGNITVLAILFRYGRHDPFLEKVHVSHVDFHLHSNSLILNIHAYIT